MPEKLGWLFKKKRGTGEILTKQRSGNTHVLSVSVSEEFYEKMMSFGISPTDAIRLGLRMNFLIKEKGFNSFEELITQNAEQAKELRLLKKQLEASQKLLLFYKEKYRSEGVL